MSERTQRPESIERRIIRGDNSVLLVKDSDKQVIMIQDMSTNRLCFRILDYDNKVSLLISCAPLSQSQIESVIHMAIANDAMSKQPEMSKFYLAIYESAEWSAKHHQHGKVKEA